MGSERRTLISWTMRMVRDTCPPKSVKRKFKVTHNLDQSLREILKSLVCIPPPVAERWTP